MSTEITFDDLLALPPPGVVEDRTYQQIYQEVLQIFAAFAPEYALFLHSDPAVKVIQVIAYREFLLRGRINSAARANLLAFSTGTDLDHLASFYGVLRRTDETDLELRQRLLLRITGFSAAGPINGYRYYALSASPDVRDANVSSPAPGVVQVSVLSHTGDGTADPALLQMVEDVVNSPDVRVLTDTVQVVSASIVPITIEADLWLSQSASASVVDVVRDGFADKFYAYATLGQDIPLSWIAATLHQVGVHHVEITTPADSLIVQPDECAVLDTFTLNYMGRDA
jgi:phage-related baseplate assembly protein